MKLNLKPLLLTTILAIGFTFQNCSSDDGLNCACPPILGEYFDIQGFEVFNFKNRENLSSVVMTENEAVDFEDYEGMTIQYQVDYHSTNCIQKKSWGFSLMNSALACSCISNGEEGSKEEKIESFTIVTLNDFDDDHLANESINDLLEVDDFETRELMDLNDYLLQDSTNVRYEYLMLRLKKAPTLNDEFRVNIQIELSTNESYTIESTPVVIQ